MDHVTEETLKSLLENRMSRVAQAQVRHHISTCFRCEEKVRQWRASIDALSDASEKARTPYPKTEGSEPTILVPAHPVILSKHSRWAVRSVLAVAAVLAVALAVETIRQGRQQEGGEGAQAGSLIQRSQAALEAGMDSTLAVRGSALPVPPTDSGTSQEPTAAPPAPVRSDSASRAAVPRPVPLEPAAPRVTGPGFTMLTVREAIERIGGPILLIRGLLPDHLEVAPASAVPGALPGSEVIRVVYREPGGRILLLDQQKIPEAYRSGLAADTLIDSDPGGRSIAIWVSGETRVTLSGRIDPETLMVFVRRVD
jgi:hypothetical protein